MQSKILIYLFLMQSFSLIGAASYPHDSISTARERVIFNTAEYEDFDLSQANDEHFFPSCNPSYSTEDVFESFYTPQLSQDSFALDILLSNLSDSMNLYMEVLQDSQHVISCFRIGKEDQLVNLNFPADSSLFHIRYFTLSPDSIQGRSFQSAYKSNFGIQRCPPGDIGGQNGIDSFALNYPYCDSYKGDLVLEDKVGQPIYNLNGLDHIISVEGDLLIGYCEHLHNLEGLENLKSVSKSISISWTNLTSIEQLTSLEQVKTFQCFGNNNLVDSVYLPSLTQITGRVTVNSNNNLTNLGMFSHVENVGQSMVISWNNALQSLNGLDSLVNVGSDLLIEYNPSLTNIDGLSSLEQVGNAFTLSQIAQITDLSGLSSLTTVEGAFYLAYLYDIQSLDGLQNVQELGNNLTIRNNDDLFLLEGLNNLTSIDGALLIRENSNLADLDALANLQSLDNYLHLIDNDNLWSISGLAQLDAASILSTSPSNKDLIIEGNNSLAVCAQDPLCSFLEQANPNFIIRQNAGRCSDYVNILDDCANSILPVVLLDFEVRAINGKAHLTWATASEINNKGFYIERGQDGRTWDNISFVEGKGTSTSEQYYGSIDEDVVSGVYFYRLKQVDYDGNETYSNVEKVSFNQKEGQAFPNPVSNLLYLNASQLEQAYTLTDITGKLIQKSTAATIDMSSLNSGIYLLYTSGSIQKILKQ